jgi:hypothetical protein
LLVDVDRGRGVRGLTFYRRDGEGRGVWSRLLTKETDPEVVQSWIEHAAEELDRMPETCALDVAERGGQGFEDVARILGMSRQRVEQIELRALARGRDYFEGRGSGEELRDTLKEIDAGSESSLRRRRRHRG